MPDTDTARVAVMDASIDTDVSFTVHDEIAQHAATRVDDAPSLLMQAYIPKPLLIDGHKVSEPCGVKHEMGWDGMDEMRLACHVM